MLNTDDTQNCESLQSKQENLAVETLSIKDGSNKTLYSDYGVFTCLLFMGVVVTKTAGKVY